LTVNSTAINYTVTTSASPFECRHDQPERQFFEWIHGHRPGDVNTGYSFVKWTRTG